MNYIKYKYIVVTVDNATTGNCFACLSYDIDRLAMSRIIQAKKNNDYYEK